MSASKVNPNVWNGEEISGGYLVRNSKPASASSPEFKGKIYMVGVGWFWLSGWSKDTKDGPLLRLRAQEMTDEQAEKFCKPRPITRSKSTTPNAGIKTPQNSGGGGQTPEIPF